MDQLNTGAAEWRPSSSSSAAAVQQPAASDLKASSVQEFVPGRAWGAAASSGTAAAAGAVNTVQQQQQSQQQHPQNDVILETTVPAGPVPPPLPSSSPASSFLHHHHHVHRRGLHDLMSSSDDLWRQYRDLSLEAHVRQLPPDHAQHKAVPLPYCNAYSLDYDAATNTASNTNRRSSFFGYPSATFRVSNSENGHLYALKRFDNVRSVSSRIAAAVLDRWCSNNNGKVVQEHPGVVPFYQCFVAQRAVFFVHHYIPGARTLKERLMSMAAANSNTSTNNTAPAPPATFSEATLWSCIAQLVSAIRCIHGSNLAVRTLRLQHVLTVSEGDSSSNSRLRVRLGSLGVVDALEFEARKHVTDLQRDDMRDLGRLILSLATGTEITTHNQNDDTGLLGRCEAYLATHYSRELHTLAMTLIKSAPHPPGIVDVARAIFQHTMDEQDAAYRALDRSERALSAEYDSSRAFRLLLKLGFINERPELGPNRRWAQSGDCYVLTLFRDYVFHQADGAGYPVLDLGHVVTALNKLDAADEEKVVLASRDGKSLMVVSYADVARCLESAFHELCSGAIPPAALQY